MAEKMSREQAALAAAEKGDVFAMYDLFAEYRNRKSLFNKNSNEEKAKTWCLKAAEGGYIKAMNIAVTYYSRDKSKYDWIDTYIRALDLLLRKYKAIYFEDDRKEELRPRRPIRHEAPLRSPPHVSRRRREGARRRRQVPKGYSKEDRRSNRHSHEVREYLYGQDPRTPAPLSEHPPR